jgi:hypothetical protein
VLVRVIGVPRLGAIGHGVASFCSVAETGEISP